MFPGRSPLRALPPDTLAEIVLILYGMDEVKDEVEVKDVEVKDVKVKDVEVKDEVEDEVEDKEMDKIEDDVEDEIKDMFPGSSPSRALTPDTLALTSF